MAIFSDQRELETQDRLRQYSATGGFRKKMGDILTSKYNPLTYTNPIYSQFAAEAFYTGDDREAQKEQRERAVNRQLDIFKLASNFLPGGPLARTATGQVSDVIESTMESDTPTEDALKDASRLKKEGEILDDLMADKDELPLESDYTTLMDAEGGDEIQKAAAGEGATALTQPMDKSSKFAAGLDKFGTGIQVAGDLANVITGGIMADRELKKSRQNIFQQKLPTSYYMT